MILCTLLTTSVLKDIFFFMKDLSCPIPVKTSLFFIGLFSLSLKQLTAPLDVPFLKSELFQPSVLAFLNRHKCLEVNPLQGETEKHSDLGKKGANI